MKNLLVYWVISFLIFFSCNKMSNLTSVDISGYRIKKIDKIHSWYIIYAERKDTLFKIISYDESDVEKKCKKILVGGVYNFDLKSRRRNIPILNGVSLKPVNHLDVNSTVYDKNGCECYLYDKNTEICTDPKKGIYDLFYTSELNGNCYLNL